MGGSEVAKLLLFSAGSGSSVTDSKCHGGYSFPASVWKCAFAKNEYTAAKQRGEVRARAETDAGEARADRALCFCLAGVLIRSDFP